MEQKLIEGNFPCREVGAETKRSPPETELYVACHDELKESYLLEDIANFLMEMGVKV